MNSNFRSQFTAGKWKLEVENGFKSQVLSFKQKEPREEQAKVCHVILQLGMVHSLRYSLEFTALACVLAWNLAVMNYIGPPAKLAVRKQGKIARRYDNQNN